MVGKGVNVVGKATVAVAGKGLDMVTGVGKEGLHIVGKGVNAVTTQVGNVAEKVLPQDLIDAAKVTREVAMEHINDASKALEDILKDPTWRQARSGVRVDISNVCPPLYTDTPRK